MAHALGMSQLPRELLAIVAARRTWPALCPRSLRHIDAAALLQNPRFHSDAAYRIDGLRRADLPQPGYTYPNLVGNAQPESFLEDEDKALPDRDAVSRAQAVAAAASPAPNPVATDNLELYPAMISKIQDKRDVERTLSRLEELWPLGTTAPNDVYPAIVATQRLQSLLLRQYPAELDLIIRFALAASKKGFAPRLRGSLVAHIARFASDRLADTWHTYIDNMLLDSATWEAEQWALAYRQFCLQANVVIRALCLAGQYILTIDILALTRRFAQRFTGANLQDNPPVIQMFTYKLVYEEFSRHETAPEMLQALINMIRQDAYTAFAGRLPEVTERSDASMDTAKGSSSSANVEDTTLDKVGDTTTLSIDALKSGLQEALSARDVQSAHVHFIALIDHMYAPTSVELESFKSLCAAHDTADLLTDLSSRLAEPLSVRFARWLEQHEQRGQLPSAELLRKFMEICLHERKLSLLKVADVRSKQDGYREISLWCTSRMHRLVQMRRLDAAQQALRIFGTHFAMIGVPRQLIDYCSSLRSLGIGKPHPDESAMVASASASDPVSAEIRKIAQEAELEQDQAERVKKIWPNTHVITVALRALFQCNSNVDFVAAAYNSFLQVTYNDGVCVLPRPMLPDPVTYTAFMEPLRIRGQSATILRIFQDMQRYGVPPTLILWNQLVGLFAREGNKAMVDSVLDRMESTAAHPQIADGQSTLIPVSALAASSDSGIVAETAVNSATPRIEDFALPPPDIITYTIIMRGFCLAKVSHHAFTIYLRLLQAKTPDGNPLYVAGADEKADKSLDILRSCGFDFTGPADDVKRLDSRPQYGALSSISEEIEVALAE